jgi:succinyl-CoA synthetase alpha subunit
MQKTAPFDFYVGIHSLEEIAPKSARVCVMNILGNESQNVTPVSHQFSGGNVVAGIQYGRKGKLETAIGDIPVYSRLAEAVRKHRFDTGVIYLPPAAVFHAVAELCHYNKELKKIIIITEKVSVKDQRLIRAVAQTNHIDVIGANCLGVADSWNHVRIGGALGGDNPEETLKKGSISIHSNSGNFSTTIAEYLKTAGFGTATVVSSGKDVIIQYAVPEFLYAAQNDPRTKAVVLYVEPGGYYEQQALEMIENGVFEFNKPMVVCVTGRWKSNLTRACGHAGALAGEGDDAISKERIFDNYFGVSVFDPDKPSNVSERGVRVASIQHIPLAMKAIFEKLNLSPDFEPEGNLGLKPWFGNDFGLNLPLELRIPIQKAIPPYDKEIEEVNKQLGATFLRQNMRNASGASRIDPQTLVAELHGQPIVELTHYPIESNMIFALTKTHPAKPDLKLVNILLNYLAASDSALFDVVALARKNGATPNQALISAVALMGDVPEYATVKQYVSAFIDLFAELGMRDIYADFDFEKAKALAQKLFKEEKSQKTEFSEYLAQRIKESANISSILRFAVQYLNEDNSLNADLFLIAAVIFHLSFPALVLKKISRQTAEDMAIYLTIEARLIFLMTLDPKKNKLIQAIRARKDLSLLETSFTDVAFHALFNKKPDKIQRREFLALLALTLTNGPGTISAKGAKESVSARNHIATAFGGYLSNTGLAHGGSGYEAIEFLLESFKDQPITDPGTPGDAIDLKKLARKVSEDYAAYKENAKRQGITNYKRIPCINHPVFKGKRVNIDPREDFIRKQLAQENINNIFWDFYHALVEALYETGVSPNIYCVNIDAVIAVISLKLMWIPLMKGQLKRKHMQDIGFLIFLMGRNIGISAEIADHRDRGLDMDCRTPQSEIRFIA